MNTLISVVIPTYKRPETLGRAIDSVLSQTYTEIEVIVIDDNNPESKFRQQTENVMIQYATNNKVRYIKHPENRNGSAARNTGIQNANGYYVAFLDDDDEFTPIKLEAQYKRLSSLDESWAACYTDYQILRNNKLIAKGVEKKEGALLDEALMRNLFICAGSNLMVRKSVLDEINGFDESFKRNQDLELLVRILMKYKIAHCKEMGLIVNFHEGANVNFEEVTKQYIQVFKPFILKLSTQDQIRVYRMINLQRFRNFVSEKEFLQAFKLIKDNEVTILDCIMYFFHLMNRYITKESRGYNL